MHQVKTGDLDKMGLLFERHHLGLYGFFFHMSRQREVSEDLVQTVFLKLLKSRHTFTGSGEFKTWLFHIARNVLNDHFRAVKRTGNHATVTEMEERIAGGAAADASIEKKQEMQVLAKAMDKLNPTDREILVLCRFQELKYSEVATILNITEGAVKVRVFRAMNQLKASYLQMATEKNYA